MGLFYAIRSKWFESTHRNKICEYTIIHYLVFFLLECCGTTRESRATYVFFMVVLIQSARIVSIFFTLRRVRLPTQGQDFVLVDKDCECFLSTQSVRIALIR